MARFLDPPSRPMDRATQGGHWHSKAFRLMLSVALVLATAVGIRAASTDAMARWVFESDVTIAAHPDAAAVELGLEFVPKTSGMVTAIRFYKPPKSSGPYTARLWDDSGEVIAAVDVSNVTSEGWQTAALYPSVAVDAGRKYTASYSAPSGRYAATEDYFSVPIETEHLRIPRSAGVYRYGIGARPVTSYRNTNYYVDVKFKPSRPAKEPPSNSPSNAASANPSVIRTTPSVVPQTNLLDLPIEPWHGGPNYYSKFPKAAAAGWTDPAFFPIAVFFGTPNDAAALKSVGINTYMGAERDGSAMSTITGEGISVLAQAEWTPAEVGNDPLVVGWHISDECDMGLSGCDQGDGEYGSLNVQRRYADERRGLNDGRFLHANFGNGVLGTFWSPNTMADHIALIDSSSVDKYAYTSPHVQSLLSQSPYWPAGRNPASANAYGWQQDRMETFARPAGSKPNWVFVETAKPFLTEDGATTIAGDQIEGAVWNSIIEGASGIAYFQHNNNDECGVYSLVDCSQDLRDTVRRIDESVKSMAPVLNTPSYVWRFGGGLDTALKVYGDHAYIVAMTDGGTGSRGFALPPGVKGTRVEVVGEARSLTVSDGTFTDSFATSDDHHIYRVTLE